MKKTLNIFALSAAILAISAALTSCQKENATPEKSNPEAPAVRVIHVDLAATVAETKATYAEKVVTIQADDQLYVVLTEPDAATWSGATGTLTYDGTSFKGDITYTGTYEGSDIITDAKDLTATFLLKGYESVNYLSATGEATAINAFYAGAKSAAVPHLVHLTASITDAAGTPKSPIDLSAQNSVLCYSITANTLTAGAHTVSVSDGTTTISGSVTAVADAATTFAVAFPASATEKDYTLSISGYNNVVKSGKTLVAGQVVNIATDVVVNPNAPLPGVFTVQTDPSTITVKFSKGNLQYQASTDTWRFAEHQYDYVSNAAGNNTLSDRDTQSDWIDLFGWGTSGNTFASGYGTAYQPWTTNSDNSQYGPTDGTSGLTGTYANGDWGVNMGTGWRTLTSDEWTYLFDTRTTGGTVFGTDEARYTEATINTDGTGVNGIILFPDGVDIASGEVTTAGTVNSGSAWATKCTTAQWAALHAKGCVFLPAAGYRDESWVVNVGNYGYYWSSTAEGYYNAYRLDFSGFGVSPAYDNARYYGYSVRLVQNQN